MKNQLLVPSKCLLLIPGRGMRLIEYPGALGKVLINHEALIHVRPVSPVQLCARELSVENTLVAYGKNKLKTWKK